VRATAPRHQQPSLEKSSPGSLTLATLSHGEPVKKLAGWCLGSVASSSVVLRQAQHEDRLFVASPHKNKLILSLSKDGAAAAAAGNFG
jgi:hypothetical protein